MNLEKLSQTQVAELLHLSTRQVRNLEDDGLPTHSEKGKKFYVWHEVLDWSRDRWESAARAEATPDSSPLEAAALLKAQADAQYSQRRLLRDLGELVADEDSEAEIRRFCERVRAGVLSLRSRYQSSILNLQTIPEAGLALDRIAAGLLTDLQRDAGGALEADDLVSVAAAAAVA